MADRKLPKNNEKAVHLRQEGNRLYAKNRFDDAVAMFNESICWAETGSEDLGIAYANRSAAFCSMREYEIALANIAVAKRNNYPERLMPKLEARERECRQQLSDPKRIETSEEMAKLYPKVTLNVEVNPRIPFIAKDMHVEEDPVEGIVMVADRDFKVGDVILSEKPLLRRTSPTQHYRCCDYCTRLAGPIVVPCPRCVYVMYCSEDCLAEAWKRFHCFECDVTEKLHEIFQNNGIHLSGVQMFLYGLSLFQDDVEKLMDFWKAHPRTGGNSLSLDYANYGPKEEFQMVQAVHARRMRNIPSWYLWFHPMRSLAVQLYNVFLENSMIKSMFTSKAKQEAMQRCFVHYALNYPWFGPDKPDSCEYGTIVSLFQQKSYADSNITSLSVGGCVKLVVHRAVPKGSRLILQLESDSTNSSSSSCNCSGIDCGNSREIALMIEEMRNNSKPESVGTVQQFIQKYSHLHTRCRRFSRVVKSYLNLLGEICERQVFAEMRASAMTGMDSP